MNKLKDDYDWNVEYPHYHKWQTNDILSKKQQFFLKDFSIDEKKNITANIHINQKFLYEFCLGNNLSSIFEVGFGYGNHLVNLRKILGYNVCLEGCDISVAQYNNSKIFHNIDKYNINFMIGDFIDIRIDKNYELIYSNAVLMHMSTDRAKKAIEKMVKYSDKYILIIDGKLPIDHPEDFCQQFGKVHLYNEFWQLWTENYTVPILITKQ